MRCLLYRSVVVVATSVLMLAGLGCGQSQRTDSEPSVSPKPALIAWAVGDGGTLLATADGVTWSALQSSTKQDLNAASFVDSTYGWVVGSGGTILHTDDGGTNWTAQDSGTTDDLQSVKFADRMHGWAVGLRGTILATTDGGSSWVVQHSEARVDLFGVTFCDASHGWAVGAPATIIATADGGAHWRTQWENHGPAAFLFSVDSSDPSRAWAVGSFEKGAKLALAVTTADGGRSWVKRRCETDQMLRGLYVADETHGWAVGGATILATADGGVQWRVENWTGVAQPDSVDLKGVAFLDSQRGWAVGKAYSSSGGAVAVTLFTADGGAAWHLQHSIAGTGLNGVATARAGSGP